MSFIFQYVFGCVGGYAYDSLRTHGFAGLERVHVVFAEMDTVHPHFHCQLYAVVKHKKRFMLLAQRYYLESCLAKFFIRSILEPQLYPFAAAFEHHLHLLCDAVSVARVCYEH